jgi:small-conductance mechanosensitive channel
VLRDDCFLGTVEAVNRQPQQPETRRNRPLQAVASLILACASAVAVNLYGVPLGIKTIRGARAAGIDTSMPIVTSHLITVGGSIAFVVLGLISTFAWARWARTVLGHFVGEAYGSIVRFILLIFGMCIILVITLSMLGFRVAQLVVGGAVTGVLLTIAAQQVLSNLFAGMLLQFAQPFKVGDSIWVRSGALAGTIEGVVTEISITYVTLENEEGRVLLPNSQVLASAVSPVRTAPRNGVLTAHRHGRFGRLTSPHPPMAQGGTSDQDTEKSRGESATAESGGSPPPLGGDPPVP